MICRIITLLTIIFLSAYGSETNEKSNYAISTQSFHQNNVPLYKYTAIHNYKRQNDDKYEQQHNQGDAVRILYAPLPHQMKSNNHQPAHNEEQLHEYKTKVTPVHLINNGRHVYSTEATIHKNHLEPRVVAQLDQHNHGQKSFIPGHNVEVLPHPTDRYLGHVDPFVTHQENNSQKVQVTAPKFVYYQKKNNYVDVTPTFKKIEKTTASNNLNLLGYVPSELNDSFLPKESRAVPINQNLLHDQLSLERPSQLYQHGPRLHLNIARFYNIANQQQKALPISTENQPFQAPEHHLLSLPQAHRRPIANTLYKEFESYPNIVKPNQTQAFFIPKIIDSENTILFPVRHE